MTDFQPLEVVLDYDRDAVVFDGKDLPFALSAIVASAHVDHTAATVTLVLQVDSVRSVAKRPTHPEPVQVQPAPSPEQSFEKRMEAIRNGQ